MDAGPLVRAYVFISHNVSVARHVAPEVQVMYVGRALETPLLRRLAGRRVACHVVAG